MKSFVKKICLATLALMWMFGRVGDAVYAEELGSALRFEAVNPGYTVDGVSNVGEMIVLRNTLGGSFLLADFSIGYINSSGKRSTLLTFPAGSEMVGETLQLRLASSGKPADLSYTKTLALNAGLELFYKGELVDKVCWNGGEGCVTKFESGDLQSLVRVDGAWKKVAMSGYVVNYNEDEPGILLAEGRGEAEAPLPHCRGLEFSEILSYYETDASEQFVELYNGSDGQIGLGGCSLRYKNKTYPLNGVVRAGEYFSYTPSGFALTKNPNSQNTLEIIDADGSVVDSVAYYNGQKKGTSWAMMGHNADGSELWLTTYAPTPGAENDYQKFKTCEAGKVINEETGNCVKATNLNTTVEPCPEGKYRNPLTGRCKSYGTSNSEVKPCAEGYERNPETGRCRRIKNNTGASYGLVAENYEEKTSFIAMGAVVAVVLIGVGYVGWQFRKEIGGFAKKIFRKWA